MQRLSAAGAEIRRRLLDHARSRRLLESARKLGLSTEELRARQAAGSVAERFAALERNLAALAEMLQGRSGEAPQAPPENPLPPPHPP